MCSLPFYRVHFSSIELTRLTGPDKRFVQNFGPNGLSGLTKLTGPNVPTELTRPNGPTEPNGHMPAWPLSLLGQLSKLS